MATHLLVWNPDRYSWRELPDLLEGFMHGRPVTARWSCGYNRRVRSRDRFFLLRLNRFPTGIFASGRIMRGAHEVRDKVAQDSGRSGSGLFAEVRFDMLTNPDAAMPLTRRALSRGALGKFRWEQGGSGRTLPQKVADALEASWAEHFGVDPAPQKPAAPPAVDKSPSTPGEKRRERAGAQEKKPARLGATVDSDRNRRFDVLFTHYLDMLEADVRGDILGHRAHVAALLEKKVGSEGVIRDRLAQTSAVLLQCGLPFVDVFPPAGKPERDLRRRLVYFLGQHRRRLTRLWLGKEAVDRVRIRDELIDMQGAWAPPPLDDTFRVEAFLHGSARFPSFGGFQKAEARWPGLHEAGCRFAMAFERARLKQGNSANLARQLRLLEAEKRNGYDIVSFDRNGDERYIRVLATQYSRRFPMLIQPRTLTASYRNPARFYLYRVFHFCQDAKLYMIQGDLRERLAFLPRKR